MKKTPIVYAIVVTYNRLNFLKQCLASIKNQTYPVKKIIVVDNCSTDGTREYLKKLYKKDPQTFQIIFNKDNLGSGNGINLALMTIQVEDWDYVWITDDDNVAEKDCLEILIKNKNKSKILGPVLLSINNKKDLSFSLYDFKKKKFFIKISEINLSFLYSLTPFNFTLIKKDCITYLIEEFFMKGEEIYFVFENLVKNIYPVTIINAKAYCINKPTLSIKRKFLGFEIFREILTPVKFYTFTRNQFLLTKKIKELIKKNNNIDYFYAKIPLFPIFYFFSNLFAIFFIFRKNQFKYLKALFYAYIDYFLLKKFGKPRNI